MPSFSPTTGTTALGFFDILWRKTTTRQELRWACGSLSEQLAMASNKVSVVLTFEMTRPYKEAERRVDAMFELPGQFQQLLDWLTSHGFKEVKPVKTDKERQYVFLATIFHPYWTLFKQKKDDRPLLSFGPTDLEADLGKVPFILSFHVLICLPVRLRPRQCGRRGGTAFRGPPHF